MSGTRTAASSEPRKKRRDTGKATIPIAATAGNVRAAFWLWILSALQPVEEERKAEMLLFGNFEWERSKPGQIYCQDKFRKWYQAKMEASGIKHYKHYNTHSFRIGGATALLAAGCTIEMIKAMGRWESDVAEIYTRPTLQQLVNLSVMLDTVNARPLEDSDDAFFDRAAGISEDDADNWAQALAAEAEIEQGGED